MTCLSRTRIALTAFAALWLAGATGCYSTKTRLPNHAKSIAVPVFANKTYYKEYTRKLEVDITDKVREIFLQNGTLKIEGRENADLILEGSVVKIERTVLRIDRLGEPAETQVRITTSIALYDVKEARYLIKRAVVTNLSNKPQSGIYSLRRGESEALGIQNAIEDLSRTITRRVLDMW